jgi:hypothetical protein
MHSYNRKIGSGAKEVEAPLTSKIAVPLTDSSKHITNIRRREQLLNVTEEDVKHAAHQYLAVPSESQQYSLAILGEQTDKINSENGWNIRSWGDSPTTSNTTAEEVFK